MTKFPVVIPLSRTNSENVTEQTKRTLALLGKPDTIISDNGPQYVGQAYQNFVKEWSINHITSSPRYPQFNGFIERQVQTVKNVIIRCKKAGEDLQLALLSLRSTPVDNILPLPADMLMKRKLASTIPHHSHAAPQYQRDALEHRKSKMQENYNKTAGRALPVLQQGQPVFIRDTETQKWRKGTIKENCPQPRSYEVTRDDGAVLRRNRRDVRPRTHQTPNARQHQCSSSQMQNSQLDNKVISKPTTSTWPYPTQNASDQSRNTRPIRQLNKPGYLKDYIP